MKDFTLIITTYNSEKHISNLLSSLVKQNYTFNILVSDDCSKDKTIDVVSSFKSSLNIQIIKNKTNIGSAMNRQKAAAKCLSEYFMFVDCDDFINVSVLMKAYKMRDPNYCVMSKMVYIAGKIVKPTNCISRNARKYCLSSNWTLCGILFSKETFAKIKFSHGNNMGEDINILQLYKYDCIKINITIHPLYYYVYRKDSFSCYKKLTKKEIIKNDKEVIRNIYQSLNILGIGCIEPYLVLVKLYLTCRNKNLADSDIDNILINDLSDTKFLFKIDRCIKIRKKSKFLLLYYCLTDVVIFRLFLKRIIMTILNDTFFKKRLLAKFSSLK